VSEKAVKDGLARHFQGWQAGVVALVVAGVGVMLGAPRAIAPTEVPIPFPDALALDAAADREAARAAAFSSMNEEQRTKAFDVRAAGNLFRKFGEADLAHDRDLVTQARGELHQAIRIVKERGGDEPLLSLRAYQLSVFLDGIAAWERTGVESDDLRLVGGEFVSIAEKGAWVGPRRRMLADRHVLSTLFLRRWAEITGLRDGAFAITPDQTRALYAFLLTHPPPGGATGPLADKSIEARATWTWTLRKVEEIAALDKTYPADLARGVAFYQLGDARAAVASFRKHLVDHPDGPHTLRARNFLTAALEIAGQ
jgi:hypothetical protein